MNFDQNTREYENQRLKHVMSQVRLQLEESKRSSEKMRNEVIGVQKSMWDHINPTPRDLDDLANIWQYQTDILREGRKAIFLSNKAEKLERLLRDPYFARIDFRENGEDNIEKIYIGISNLKDEISGEYLIYDWRAPVSSMFYDYETGQAGYLCPSGEIEGYVYLKRQYRIWNGILEFMFDSSLAINDDILQEVLGKSADSRMKTIVASIQREQNRAIRDDTHRLLLVQGPAGSGKTSIALHRAAYLLYRYKESISADNIVIFSPNSIFSDYISDVLPELGEENINRTTFSEYARKVLGQGTELEDAARQLEYLLNNKGKQGYNSRIESISRRSSKEFIKVIKDYAAFLEDNRTFEDVTYNGRVIESKEEISEYFRHGLKFLPIAKRLAKIRSRLVEKLDEVIKTRIEEVVLELANRGEYLDKAEIRGRSTFIVREEFKPVRERIERMTELKLFECYAGLLGEKDKYASAVYGKVPFEDIAPLLLLNGLLFGFPSMDGVKHVIIDEVQDYSAVQLELFSRLFGGCGMTLLGDANQAINPYASGVDTDDIVQIMGSKESIKIHLNKSYRSTKQIAAFCRGLLSVGPETGYIDRAGELPELICIEQKDALFGFLADHIRELKKGGFKSIAVITRTESESGAVYAKLSEYAEVILVSREDSEFFSGTAVIPSYLSKGLEFDAVLAVCPDRRAYSGAEESKLIYTVCTRALHRLNIYSMDGVPDFMQNMDKTLFTIIKR